MSPRPPDLRSARRLRPGLLLAVVLALPLGLPSPGRAAPPVEIGLYGDVLYSRHDYGPDQRSGPAGAPADHRATTDLAFLVAEFEIALRPDLLAEIELEIEHGGTGAALELEYEEFGEYELDVDKGGEIEVEQFHLTKVFAPALALRAGHFLTAVGLANRSHEPVDFFPTTRSEAEGSVIPNTWDETGLEIFGAWRRLAYRLQLVNGLDSSAFSSKFWVALGKQGRFENVRATDLAVASRLDVDVVPGVTAGISAYHGDTSGNRPKPDLDTPAAVTIADVHVEGEVGPLRGRALFLRGHLRNADVVTAKNSRLSTNLLVPRTPVARGATSWYAEVGYDVASLLGGVREWKLYPFVHYGRYDTMADVDPGIFADPRFDRRLVTTGLDFFPHEDVVVKADFTRRTFGRDTLRPEQTFAIDVGFVTDWLE